MLNKVAGQLLIEVLVALAIILTALVVSLAVVSQASHVSRTTRSRLEATKYANTVLEDLRRQRDADSEAFFSNASCGTCGPYGANGEYTCQVVCTFTPTQVEVIVQMTWDDGGGSTANLSTSTILARRQQ